MKKLPAFTAREVIKKLKKQDSASTGKQKGVMKSGIIPPQKEGPPSPIIPELIFQKEL